MTIRSLILVGTMALASLSLASAKSFEFSISTPTTAGSAKLKPGQYKLEVSGNNAVFTLVNRSESVTTPVKIETVEKKYDATALETAKQADGDHVQAIRLGGSKTRLVFD